MTVHIESRMRDLLEQGVGEGVFPGAVLLVSKGEEIVLTEVVGSLSIEPGPAPMKRDTIFDLASLTKPLATTLALMKIVDSGAMDLDEPLGDVIKKSLPEDKRGITPRFLLNHCAGLKDWEPFYRDLVALQPRKRRQALRERIVSIPLAYGPGDRCLYSDLGFMILEWAIEEATGQAMGTFVKESFYEPLRLERIFLASEDNLKAARKGDFAATEYCPWRNRVIQGEVHDENAYALGGYSGHAGLFGAAEGVYGIAGMLREHYFGNREDYLSSETVRAFFSRQDIVTGSTWALGWDTPSPEASSSGRYFSENSVGHLGYTGTSLWVDLEKDVIVILLTNRVHPTRNNEKIKEFRPILHDRVMEALGLDR
ncbi:MAG: serine hydrolase [Deltaproteobacteria bacterium]|nr:serine hydrolase [Deltaproteobacteria bacterium]